MEADNLKGLRVLLVEDQYINQEVAAEILRHWGITVDIVDDGLEALKFLASTTVDVVLMDIHMPGLDGYQTTPKIRSELGLTQLPIIAMTAATTAKDRQLCLDAGMNDFVSKPIVPELLRAALVRQVRVQSPPKDSL